MISKAVQLSVLSFYAGYALGQACYFPDHQTISGDQPCNVSAVANGGVSACCGSSAWCLDNGLCYGKGIISRGSCSDQSWSSPDCPQYCNTVALSSGTALSPCNADSTPSFFCGVGTAGDPCANSELTFRVEGGTNFLLRQFQVDSMFDLQNASAYTLTPGTVKAPPGTSNASVTAATSSTAPTSSTSATPTNTTSCSDKALQAGPIASSDKYSAGAMAGVGAGVGVPLLLIALLASLFALRERRKNKKLLSQLSRNGGEMRPDQYGYPGAPAGMYGHGQYMSHAQSVGGYSSTAPTYLSNSVQPYYKHEPIQEVDGQAPINELGDESFPKAT